MLVVNKIGSLVINDDLGAVVGIVTSRDLMKVITERGKKALEMMVSSILSSNLITINENELLKHAVNKMELFAIHHLLVKNNAGNISGLISSFDIVREAALNVLKL